MDHYSEIANWASIQLHVVKQKNRLVKNEGWYETSLCEISGDILRKYYTISRIARNFAKLYLETVITIFEATDVAQDDSIPDGLLVSHNSHVGRPFITTLV
jgi:hypothetical protein